MWAALLLPTHPLTMGHQCRLSLGSWFLELQANISCIRRSDWTLESTIPISPCFQSVVAGSLAKSRFLHTGQRAEGQSKEGCFCWRKSFYGHTRSRSRGCQDPRWSWWDHRGRHRFEEYVSEKLYLAIKTRIYLVPQIWIVWVLEFQVQTTESLHAMDYDLVVWLIHCQRTPNTFDCPTYSHFESREAYLTLRTSAAETCVSNLHPSSHS